MPAELKRYSKFINSYCWLRGTYYANQTYDERVFSLTPTKDNLIQYYQWVAVFLLGQAVLFYVPYVLWNFIANKTLDVQLFFIAQASKRLDQAMIISDPSRFQTYLVSQMSASHPSPDLSYRIKQLKRAAKLAVAEREFQYIDRFSLNSNSDYLVNQLSNSYLCISYIFVKFLYLIVVLVQIFVTSWFLRY